MRKLVSRTNQTYTVKVLAAVKKGIHQPKRTAQVRLPAPSYVKGHPGLKVWMVRAWEPDPPAGTEVVEWILITSLTVNDWDAARYVTQIYECRRLVEVINRRRKRKRRRGTLPL